VGCVWRCIFAGLVLLALVAPSVQGESAGDTIDFGRDIRPILADRCFKCHGPDAGQRQAGLRLDAAEHLLAGGDSGESALVPGKPQQSQLFRRITDEDPSERMPPQEEGARLSPAEINRIRDWIGQGAEVSSHWAFVAPRRAAMPPVNQPAWARTPIDHFVLARLERKGLAPAPTANRRTLIRRLSFDLLGLPPSSAEVDAFVRDKSPDAYERLVERMLDSPHYGERLAQNWLDLARYADTTGFAADSPRPMWLYRDWVIDSLNKNMPFDQFTIAQLAGDMLPEASDSDRLATGFHRNSMQALGNNPPKEEFRVKGIIDRVNTTARVWMGLTVGCAECHDHKFDPVTQRDYYGLFAIFNNIPHYGEKFGVHGPRIKTTSPLAERRRRQIELELASLHRQLPPSTKEELSRRQQHWEKQLAELLPAAPQTTTGERTATKKNHPALVAHWPLTAGQLVDRGPSPARTHLLGAEKGDNSASGQAGLRLPAGVYLRAEDCDKLRVAGDLTLTARIQTRAEVADIVCKYDSQRAERAFVFGIGGEGEANATPGSLFAWISGEPERFEGVQVYGSIPVNDGKPHHVALVFRGGESIDLFVDGHRDTTARRQGEIPARIAASKCDLLLGAGYGLDKDENKYFLDGLLQDVRIYRNAIPAAAEIGALPPAILAAVSSKPSERTDAEQESLDAFFRSTDWGEAEPELVHRIESLAQELSSLKRPTEAQVMLEMAEPRATHIHLRGDFEQPGERVDPAVPACLSRGDESGVTDRLAFARWLVDPDHPLTARVAVNRFWQHYFGSGLVRTADDFGLQGAWPSHPALLDWLAVEFIDSGWDIKALQRLIVNSASYRQSSETGNEAYDRDPANRLLGRGPRFRLPAEQIRDNALAISGLLSRKLGGPSVYPLQPAGLLEEKGQLQYHPAWITSSHSERYRRGLYVYWKRMHLYPSLATFGAPTRERCTVERPLANTPLQALVLLNDPVFVEAARHFAQQILAHGGDRVADQIDYALQRCLGRAASDEELERYLRWTAQMRGQMTGRVGG
jgi:hypothetical protein